MADDDIILETKGLTKHYGGVHALNDTDFVLRKESMLRMGDSARIDLRAGITGKEQCTSGTIIFDGGRTLRPAGPGSRYRNWFRRWLWRIISTCRTTSSWGVSAPNGTGWACFRVLIRRA